MKYTYSSEWVHSLESKKQWEYYWHQQKLLENNITKNDNILEVGVGSGFTTNYLLNKGFDVKTIDIDANKNPDIVENIVTAQSIFYNYNVLLAFNIFEHIPYSEFLEVIEKLNESRVSKIFLGLPIFKKIILQFYFSFILLKPIDIHIYKKRKKLSANHFWELAYKDFHLNKIIEDLNKRGFQCKENIKYLNQQYLYFNNKNNNK
ncbi:MAG: hypothetical protein K9I68_01820 [Bacteroidales bacterium]|nr:hypothetical protein [Bacteroidales bacterium]MCF8337154.1 hypothetical protein [Bacteroidales bacterium]